MADTILGKIESDAYGASARLGSDTCLRSIAISMKRIADAVNPPPPLPLTPAQIDDMKARWAKWFDSPPPDSDTFRGEPLRPMSQRIADWLRRICNNGGRR